MSTKQRITPGPAGTTVATNMERFRRIQGISYVDLSRRLKQLGRPIAPLGLTRIRDLQRRVDVDDLVALAHALGVEPVDLLRQVPDGSRQQPELVAPAGDVQQTIEWLNTPASDRGELPPFPSNARIGPIRLKVRVRADGPPIEIDLVPLLENLDSTQDGEDEINGDD
ncbi:hypothetical protein NWP13_21995 [Rhodococcus pyridinivorans]|nr:hypothetical protein [Rhodococcus pyridinivorans]